MASEHRVLFSAEVIAETVRELAASIDRDYGNDALVVLTVMKGAVIFAADLVRAMDTETELAYVEFKSHPGHESAYAPGRLTG